MVVSLQQPSLFLSLLFCPFSLNQWTWVWVDSGSWWWTGRPGVLRFMGWQRVRHDWETELNWTEQVVALDSLILCLICKSRVDLQCCVSFRCATKWFSYRNIRSFKNSFLIQVFTEYWVELPVLYGRSLFIYLIYSSLFMFTPISWFIPAPYCPLFPWWLWR